MANTISAYAREYVNNQMETLQMFNTFGLSNDLVKPLISHRGKYISYDSVSLGASAVGSYNRATGFTNMDITATRVEKELTQDKGNSLYIDAMDATEAQIEGSVVRLFNQYMIQKLIPAVDAYRFSVVGAYSASTEKVHASLTSSNIVSALLADKATLEQKRVKFAECIIYIASSKKALLDEANYTKAVLTLGGWNGDATASTELFYGAKVISVPDATLDASSGISWVIVHPLAVDAFVVAQDATFFEEIPGFGNRKKEVDVGCYHDCFVRPDGTDGIIVSVETSRAPVGA